MTRSITAAVAAAFAAGVLLLPAAAQAVQPLPVVRAVPLVQAAPILTENSADTSCTVTGGELHWGVKEGFRSYISGSIANGSWQLADGTSYETPRFGWANPVGQIDAETGEGTVSFTGSIQFSGHEGVLNLLIANPTIVLNGDGTAQLRLDTRSNNAQGELVVDEQQAYLGKIEGLGGLDPASGSLVFEDAPAVLTADGAAAFGGFYASGDELDPVSLSLQLGPCEGGTGASGASGAAGVEGGKSAEGAEDAGESPPLIAAGPAGGVPWLPIVVGGVAVVVIGITAGMLIADRKKHPATPPTAPLTPPSPPTLPSPPTPPTPPTPPSRRD